jgi:8-amino-7-oxononanoate synthase
MTALEARLQQLRERHLFRERRLLDSPQGIEVVVDGEHLLSFCSNDYLGLAADPRLIAAFKAAAERYGVGAGASHLVTGHSRAHHALEEELAEFVGAERALVFSTGYMANLAVVTTLLERHDLVLEDRLNHASLIDAVRLARVDSKRYRHADADHAASLAPQDRHSMIVTDAVFSMDGDLAPLPALAALAAARQAWLLVDDAHGFGVLGQHGRGSLDHFGLRPAHPIIYMGTLGKAAGTFGAFVAGSADLIETLIQSARTYIYTTALPPAVAEATRASLRLIGDGDERRENLFARVRQFRRGAAQLGLALWPSATAIQPVILGDSERALQVAEQLRRAGILVPAIRPPTVPADSARLRITFSAAHDEAHVERLLAALEHAVR